MVTNTVHMVIRRRLTISVELCHFVLSTVCIAYAWTTNEFCLRLKCKSIIIRYSAFSKINSEFPWVLRVTMVIHAYFFSYLSDLPISPANDLVLISRALRVEQFSKKLCCLWNGDMLFKVVISTMHGPRTNVLLLLSPCSLVRFPLPHMTVTPF
ncbi:hypothetical protein F5050DRAFT_977631 [Lentinula boryana]|uniref:Uncharacterized protein n=1 Tax=Lentinula boryana TaxID=40481 RepID=A0ABQ8QLL8_9AGAR|nr:hypothetical protein F5050DRAFT_977631 [Lentinula boryana]